MTRIVTFYDGFLSATPPDIDGAVTDTYEISNNTIVDNFIINFDTTAYYTYFIEYELERSVTGTQYRQAGTMIVYFDGTNANVTFGNYVGDDMLVAGVPTGNQVKFAIAQSTPSTLWRMYYHSGEMVGSGYVGNLKVSITRIRVA